MSEKSDKQADFRILIATDNHLGAWESHPRLHTDSFNTFEEILVIGKREKVDFLLLGGDLFHENRPSKRTMVNCMNALARYCRGDAPIYMKLISDASENFKGAVNPIPNWEDPNLNISLPIFSIHGNHDDPTGLDSYCALDELGAAGLINYIGRVCDFNREIVLSPVLLKKGNTTIALYGMSAMRDERVYRLFFEKKVRIIRHSEPTFNILVLHQNRVKHTEARYMPETFLDFRDGDNPFFHLVVWGHEHECKLSVETAVNDAYYILQPGSSVPTSFCPGEAVEKRVFVLSVSGQDFNVTHRRLQTVRPMIHKTLVQKDLYDETDLDMDQARKEVEANLKKAIEKALEDAQALLTGHSKQPTMPVIRFNIEYEENFLFDPIRFGFLFSEEVANFDSMILIKKVSKKSRFRDPRGTTEKIRMDYRDYTEYGPELLEELVEEVFKKAPEKFQLRFIDSRLMTRAFNSYLLREDESMGDYVQSERKFSLDFFEKLKISPDIGEEKIREYLDEFRAKRKIEVQAECTKLKEAGPSAPVAGEEDGEFTTTTAGNNRTNDDVSVLNSDTDEDDDGDEAFNVRRRPAAAGRQKRQPAARGSTRGRGRGAARMEDPASGDDDGTFSASPVSGRGRGRGRGRAAGRRAAKADVSSSSGRQTTLDSFRRTRR